MSEKFPFFLNLTVLPLQREQAQLALSLSPSLLFPALLLFSIYLPLARSLALNLKYYQFHLSSERLRIN
jgi:hypothetical protein